VTDEPRRARAAWALHDAAGERTQQGGAEAVIDDEGLSVGLVRVAFVDADALRAEDYRIELDLWPAGRLVLTELGRRFDTFTQFLRQARNQARVAGLLAHAPALPEVFEGVVLSSGSARSVELQVYSTHLTIVPADVDPWQLPLGALSEVVASDDPPGVMLTSAGERIVIGQLARRRDAFFAAVSAARNAQAQLLARYTNRSVFTDGTGVLRGSLSGFDLLLGRCSSAERLDGARRILAGASGGEPRLGFVQLLDPDAETLQAASPLPENWASFLLAPVGKHVVLEMLSGPSAATYVFEGAIDAVNLDLQLLHFRRAALALTPAQAEITPDNPQRLALRRLAPLQRLRAVTRARLLHGSAWNDSLAAAISAR
jgi:hypothetical protein